MSRHLEQTKLDKNAQAAELILSKNPDQAMQEMMDIIDNFKDVLVEETKALDETDTKTFFNLQDRKREIARDYQSGVNQILVRKDEMKQASPAAKAKLEKMRENFFETTQENMKAIERMNKGMKRLSDRIMSIARDNAQQKQQLVYKPSGEIYKSRKTSIGVNESA